MINKNNYDSMFFCLGFLYCQRAKNTEVKQTNLSLGLRVTAVALGIILFLGGVFILGGLPGLGMAGGWAAFSTGIVLMALGVSIQCIRNKINENDSFDEQPVTKKGVNTGAMAKVNKLNTPPINHETVSIDQASHSITSATIMSQNHDANGLDDKGWAPIHYAARIGSIKKIDILLANRADINILTQSERNGAQSTPLHLSILNNHLTLCEHLLNRGADPNVSGKNCFSQIRTPLHLAAEYANLECLDLLLKSGANVNAIGMDGKTALHCVVDSGNANIIKRLLEEGADIYIKDENHNTPFDLLLLCRNSPGYCFRPPHTNQWNPQVIDELITYANNRKQPSLL